MQYRSIFLEILSNRIVAGLTDVSPFAPPPFTQGDVIRFKVYLIASSDPSQTPIRIPTSGITLLMALGEKTGIVAPYYASQVTWTPNSDLSDPYWEAEFLVNTPAITALLQANKIASAWFSIQIIDNGDPVTVLNLEVTINAATIKPGSTSVPAGQTPLSLEVARAMFLGRTIQGMVRWVSPDGTQQADVGYGNDGTWHVDPVT